MKRVDYTPGNDWSGARTTFEDEYGNRGEVRWPRLHTYGLRNYFRWDDAEVNVQSTSQDDADGMAVYAEFCMHLAHVTKTLDLAFAQEKQQAEEERERSEVERERREAVRAKAMQYRCEFLAQFYMQMVRVQREGHSSHAKGELNVTVLREGTDEQSIKRQMFLRESNGNRWTFDANAVAKFEVKDGNRYEAIDLTPMSELEETARKELQDEQASQV
jgi:hypothetical protein